MQISSYLNNILKLISSNPIVSILVPIGAGQNLSLPTEISKTGAKIYVAVPTEKISTSLTNNITIFQRNFNNFSGDNITYVTRKFFWNKLISYFSATSIAAIDFSDVIICPELYPEDLDYIIITSLWKRAYDFGIKVPRLVFANSMTFNSKLIPAPAEFRIPIIRSPEISYYDKAVDITRNELYGQAAELAYQIHTTTVLSTGDIMIILPGKKELNICNSRLTTKKNTSMNIISVSGSFLETEPDPNKRNIILVTSRKFNFITAKNINYITDTMAEKIKETIKSGGIRRNLHYISQDVAQQHSELCNICWRMCNKKLYDQLEKRRTADQESISGITTETLRQGINPESILPGIDRITKTIEQVKKLSLVNLPDLEKFTTSSDLSLRNSTFLWHWINGRRFYDKLIQDGKQLGLNLENMEIDETSEYSSIKPHHVLSVMAIFAAEQVNPNTIIDATANVGGDSIIFLKQFPNAKLIALEIDPKIAKILKRNLSKASKILGTEEKYDIHAINISAVTYFNDSRYADLIYFDPEWGGREYITKEKIILTLDGEGVGLLIGKILAKGMTSLVVIKVPINVDLDTLLTDVVSQTGADITIQSYDVTNSSTNVIDYNLLFIRYQGIQIDNISPEPEEVPLSFSTYPMFPGIVVACLIDSYGPSYFQFPRVKQNVNIQEHKDKYFSKFIGYNDLESCLNIWREFMNKFGNINVSPEDVTIWCQQNSINNRKIIELLSMIKRTVGLIENQGYPIKIVPVPFTTNGVVTAARPLLRSIYSDSTFINKYDGVYFSPITREEYNLDNQETVNQLANNPPLGVISLFSNERTGTKGIIRFITFAIDTDKDGLGRSIIKRNIRTPQAPRSPKFQEKYVQPFPKVKEFTRTKKLYSIPQPLIPQPIISKSEFSKSLADNPFDILDKLRESINKQSDTPKIKREGKGVIIYGENNPAQYRTELFIAQKITQSKSNDLMEILTKFYKVNNVNDKNKWSSKTIKKFTRFDKMLKFAPLRPKVYLDIGSGPATDFDLLVDRLKPKRAITSDIKDFRVEKNSEFITIEPGNPLILSDESVDIVSIFHALHHSADALYRFDDIKRLLRPKGILLLKDHDVITDDDANIVSFEHLVYSIGEGTITVADADRYNEIEPMYYYSAAYIKEYLMKLGFKELFFEKYSGPTKVYTAVFQKLGNFKEKLILPVLGIPPIISSQPTLLEELSEDLV